MSKGGNLAFILQLIRPFRSQLLLSVVLMLSGGLLSSADPLLMQHLIDRELPQGHLGASLLIVLAIGGCLLASSLAVLASGAVTFNVEQAIAQNLRLTLLEQLNRLSVRFHESTPTGENITRMGSDVDQISQLSSDFFSSTMRACAFLVFNIAVMLYMNRLMTLAILPALGLFVVLQPRFAGVLRSRAEHAQKEIGRASSVVTEYVSALPQIQLLCAEKVAMRNASAAWIDMITARKRQKSSELLYSGTINGAFALATFLVLGFGSYLYSLGALTIGALVAFYAYQIRLFQPVSVATDLFSRFQRTAASVSRVSAILDSEDAPEDRGTITAVPLIKKGIAIAGLGYSYLGDRTALRNISLEIAAGESVAIVGPSGSGKSTLARILVRVSDPDTGHVTLDGYPLTEYSLAALRKAICYVPQRPVLFDGSIRENLLFARPQATDPELASAITIAQFHPVLEKLHQGLDTRLGPFGQQLSGGELQRLALARALIRQAPILILDESTSALDVPTEKLILESIARSRTEGILVIITHRLASVSGMNRILLLENGQLVGAGNHSSLYSQSQLYRQLCDSTSLLTSPKLEYC